MRFSNFGKNDTVGNKVWDKEQRCKAGKRRLSASLCCFSNKLDIAFSSLFQRNPGED